MSIYRIECPECHEDTLIITTYQQGEPYGESYAMHEVVEAFECENDCPLDDDLEFRFGIEDLEYEDEGV